MKPAFKNCSVSILFLILFISFGFSQTTKKKNKLKQITFNNSHKSPDISTGFWFATEEDNQYYIQFMDSNGKNGRSYNVHHCFNKSEISNSNSAQSFEIVRAAGTMYFKGNLNQRKNTGTFRFERNSSFESFLENQGLVDATTSEYAFFKLFLGAIDQQYVTGLQKRGYEPTLKQLGSLGIHKVSMRYIEDLEQLGYADIGLKMIVNFAIHNIKIDYIKGLKKLGHDDMSAQMVKNFAIHSISLKYIEGLQKLGYKTMSAQMIKNFAIHSIALDYISGLQKLGYNLDPSMLKNFAIHSISVNYIKGLNKMGYNNLDPQMLKNFKIHGINAPYIQSLKDTKVHIADARVLKKAKIHGVSANFIKRAQQKGHNTNELSDYIKLKIHGI